MRTFEERAHLIHKRTEELRRKERKRKMLMIDAACTAACLLAVIGVGAYMPVIAGSITNVEESHSTGAASIVGEQIWTGHIMVALLGFLAGMCLTVLLYRLHRRSKEDQSEN